MATTPTYKDLAEELEAIIDEIQSGRLDLELASEKYKKGLTIVDQMLKLLNQTENSIKQVGQTAKTKAK